MTEWRFFSVHNRLVRQWTLVIGILLFILFMSVPLPFYLTQPGSVVELAPIIQVEDGKQTEQGNFMLTTVRLWNGSALGFIYSLFVPYVNVVPKNVVQNPHETDEQYSKRQKELMDSSQENAMAAAFHRAGLAVKVENRGALVMMVFPELPAEKLLKIGDVITKVEDKAISKADEMINLFKNKKVGEKVALTFKRDGQEMTGTVELVDLHALNKDKTDPAPDPDADKDSASGSSPKAGIGVYLENDRQVILPRKVTINSSNIGGPSAGLMFSLEIFNQLTEEDFTRGYRIAGTGTIDENGVVGPIGGIGHKVVAAHRAGAEIFFAPDTGAENGPTNYEEALEVAEDLGTQMKIISVHTLDDAVSYLQGIKPKP